MRDRSLSKEWIKLTTKEKEFIKTCKKQNPNDNETKELSKKLIKLDWIYIVDNTFNASEKYIKLKKQKIPNFLNLKALEKQLKDGLTTKEDFLFTLEVFEERIKEVNNLALKDEACKSQIFQVRLS